MKISAALLLTILTSFNSAFASKECCLCGDSCAAVAPEKVDLITVSPFVVADENEPQGAMISTCEEIAMELLDSVQEEEEMCAKVRYDYQEACCSSGKCKQKKLVISSTMCFLFSYCIGIAAPLITRSLFARTPLSPCAEPVELFELDDKQGYMESLIQGARELWGTVSFTFTSGSNNNNVNPQSSGGGAESCTHEPVGVGFPTPGGNFGFGICRDGSYPSAAAQGATIWDPNERRAFQGNCGYVDSMARQGYMANNMCGITRLRLDGPCCSNPTHTQGSLGQSWSACRGSC